MPLYGYIIAKQVRDRTAADGVLAQLGEHLPYKQRVTGSSPVGPIPFEKNKRNKKRWRDSSVG